MGKVTVESFDTAEMFSSREDQIALIGDALASGDSAYVAHALGVVARAQGMGDIASETGLSRQSLYKALSKEGNPRLDTLMAVLASLGLELQPVAMGR